MDGGLDRRRGSKVGRGGLDGNQGQCEDRSPQRSPEHAHRFVGQPVLFSVVSVSGGVYVRTREMAMEMTRSESRCERASGCRIRARGAAFRRETRPLEDRWLGLLSPTLMVPEA